MRSIAACTTTQHFHYGAHLRDANNHDNGVYIDVNVANFGTIRCTLTHKYNT